MSMKSPGSNSVALLKHALRAAFSASVATGRKSGVVYALNADDDRFDNGMCGTWIRINHPGLAHFEVRAVPTQRVGQAPFHHELRDTSLNNRLQSEGKLDTLDSLASRFARYLRNGLIPSAGYILPERGAVCEAPGRPRT